MIFWNSLKFPIFNNPTSTVIITEKGELLSARIADDGQWRFPESDSIPEKFEIEISKESVVSFSFPDSSAAKMSALGGRPRYVHRA